MDNIDYATSHFDIQFESDLLLITYSSNSSLRQLSLIFLPQSHLH